MENIKEYLAIATAIYTAASIIVRLTPTKKDDEILSKIGKVFNKVVGLLRSIFVSHV